ncbi:ATP-dependent DNA helicase Q4 [Eumeta japonica]|uniref:DNA 3'-5' helicase n=1 Tax=Eumeta variegata TaxID=151549 RepID=A0A4C1U0J5_EUMVA|nr:ATP-dependent DNA helicase Q4 [Eumeta japonica]
MPIKTKTKLQQKAKSKDENEQPPSIDEFVPFGLENNVNPRHINNSIVLQTKINTDNSNKMKLKKSNRYVENEDRLQEKIKNGTLNDNFVKINIEKKVFVRGKKSVNYSKYKKQQWKQKKILSGTMEFPDSGKILCFKCGQDGHMARYCTAHKGDSLLPLSAYKPDTIPSLQEMEIQGTVDLNSRFDEELSNLTMFVPSPIPQAVLTLMSNTNENNKNVSIKPIYDDYNQETPQELIEALHMFGHESFRSGQEQAIKRILCGLSTLLILSTGSGKSLCYQLPAYIYKKYYKCITLVISPLVSLMEDQVLNMPDFLKAACLHTNQPPTVRKKIIQFLKDGDISVLLISPEALVSGDGSNGFGGLFKALPPIAFACIDEAHCVSQWSHNFRPSYLMICRVLKEKLKVKCILGLTATASKATVASIVNHINIPDGSNGVITNPTLPDNLILLVSHENDKDSSLITLLNTEPVNCYSSIIIYCIRRNECERLAALLRSALQEPRVRNMEKNKRKRKRLSLIAEAYHAGISAAQRKRIQNNFMDGTLRIIVATIAFGMGINKSDIRCIIHYNMPSSFESYVQEVGRAGRDGKRALCHVLINNQSNDKNELLKHVYSNTMDRNVIRKLLQKIFIPCDCGKNQDSDKTKESMNNQKCTGHEVAIPIDETEEELDIASENIATLLCYLELNPLSNVKVLNNTYTTCKIFSYDGPQAIIEATKKCPPLAMAYKLQRNKDIDLIKKNILEFPVVEVAAAIGWESGVTKYYLKNLEWDSDGGITKRSQFTVQFHTLGFRIKAPGDLTATELDEILDHIHETVQSQERKMVHQLEEIDRAFTNITKLSIRSMNLSEDNEQLKIQSNELKSVIRDYFTRDNVSLNNIVLKERPLDEAKIISDIRALMHTYKDCNFTGRSIARIFQGIASPNYPAIVWSRCKFWRSHIHEDFYCLIRLATQQLIEMKLK